MVLIYIARKISMGVVDDTDSSFPDIPLTGWESVDYASYMHVDKIPIVTHG